MAIARRTDVQEAVDLEVAEAKVAGWAAAGKEEATEEVLGDWEVVEVAEKGEA